MNISVILAHPHPGSFNHAIAGATIGALQANGHSVRFHDLFLLNLDQGYLRVNKESI